HPAAARLPRMRPRAHEHAKRGVFVPEAEYLERPALDGRADRGDSDAPVSAHALEQRVEIGQAIGLEAGDVQASAGQADGQADAAVADALGGNLGPRTSVRRDRHRAQLTGDRARLAVPDVVEIAELQGDARARPPDEREVDVTGSTVW